MYRVFEITGFFIRSRAKEIGIMFAILFGIFVLIVPAAGLIIFAAMLKLMGILFSLAFIFTSSLSGVFNDYKISMYKGITRETFAKSYTISSLLLVLALTIFTVAVRLFPVSGFEVDLGISLLGVDLEEVNTIHSIVLHLMILLSWSGLTSVFTLFVFKRTSNRINTDYIYIVTISVILVMLLSRMNLKMDWLLNLTSIIGYSIPLTLIVYGMLSIGLYYMSYRMIKNLEV